MCVLRVLSVHHIPAPSGFDLLFIIYTASTFPPLLLFLSETIVGLCACVSGAYWEARPVNFNLAETSLVFLVPTGKLRGILLQSSDGT